MKEFIANYLTRTETLLSANSEYQSVTSFIEQLKILCLIPDAYLSNFDEAIPLVYASLEDGQKLEQQDEMLKLFSQIVTNSLMAVAGDKLEGKLPDFDDSFIDLLKLGNKE